MQLSTGILKETSENPGIKTEGILQYISSNLFIISGTKQLIAKVSDGPNTSEIIINQKISALFQSSLSLLSLVKMKLIARRLNDTIKIFCDDFELLNQANGLENPSKSMYNSIGGEYFFGMGQSKGIPGKGIGTSIHENSKIFPSISSSFPIPKDMYPEFHPTKENLQPFQSADSRNPYHGYSGMAPINNFGNERQFDTRPMLVSKLSHTEPNDYQQYTNVSPYSISNTMGSYDNPRISPVDNYNRNIMNDLNHPQTQLYSQPNLFQNLTLVRPQFQLQMLPQTGGNFLITRIGHLFAGDRNWKIKGRVIAKQEMKEFKNEKGKYFSVVLEDSSSKIRATFFNSAAEIFFKQIHENSVYYFSDGTVEKASKYNTTDHHFEIIFKDMANVELAQESVIISPREINEFSTVSDAQKRNQNELINMILYIQDEGVFGMKDLKRGGQKPLKQPIAIDKNGEIIEISLWGEFARDVSLVFNHAYMIRSIKIKKFEEHTFLVWENYTKIVCEVSPDHWTEKILPAQINKLNDFSYVPQPVETLETITFPLKDNSVYTCPANVSTQDPSQPTDQGPLRIKDHNVFTLSEINKRCEEFFSSPYNKYKKLVLEGYGFLSHISKNIWYDSCGHRNCKKKIKVMPNDTKYCEKCRLQIPNPITRYMADVKFIDGVDCLYGRIFGEDNCVNMFDLDIDHIKNIRNINEEEYYRIVRSVEGNEFYFQILIRKSEYQGENRIAVEFLLLQKIEVVLNKLIPQMVENLIKKSQSA